jgi:hypothetical protein
LITSLSISLSFTEPTMPPSRNGSSGFRWFLLLVQAYLGNIDTWPSRVLNLIFIDEYDPPNSIDTVAFFYGNRVPLKEALCFYTLCNDHSPLMSIIHFTLLYRKFESGPVDDPTCDCIYYDMRLKKLQKLHGPQPDSSGDVDIPLGIDATGNSERIRARLTQVFD